MTTEQAVLRTDVLTLGRSVHLFAISVLSKQTAPQDDNARIFLFAQVIRMHRTAEAVRTLVAAELNDAAGAVLRCLLEQMYVFTAVHKDSSNLQQLAAESRGERHKALKGLLQLADVDRAEELTSEAIAAALEELQAGGGFNAHDWARRSGHLDHYRTYWRTLCAYAHGSIDAVCDYLDMGDNGEVLGIRSKIAELPAIEFVLVASAVVLEAVSTFKSQADASEVEAEEEDLADKHRALYERYWKLKS